MAEADFRVLGVAEATVSGRSIDLGHARQRAVLAVLLVEAGRVVPTGQLTHWVWDTSAPAEPRKTLYSYVSRLRGQLSGSDAEIQRYRGGYLIDIDPVAVDMHRFERLIGQARSAAGDEYAAPLWREALALWRGEPFEDLDVPWLRAVADRLSAQHYMASADYRDLRLRRGEHAELLPELQAGVADNPLDERLAAQFMLALYRDGRQADALACYERLRRRLADELGSDPEPDTQTLYHQILTADEALAAPPEPAPVPTAEPAGNVPVTLPWAVRDFTGRDDELSQLDKLVNLPDQPATAAAVVISGTGGTGKTALVAHWAHQPRIADAFPDGRIYVNLRGFSDHPPMTAEDAVRNLLRQLGVPGSEIPAEVDQAHVLYRHKLAGRRVLVLLDNAADAEQVRPLLVEAPSLALVTSRNRLTGLAIQEGAVQIALGRMPDSDVGELTTRLLGEGHPRTETTRLSKVCGQLPLAIRVAANGYQTSHPETRLSDFIDQLTVDRTGILDATADDATAITTVLSWSTRQLPPDLREAFCRIGLHPGPRMDIGAVAAMLDGTELRARRVVRELASVSLLEETSPNRWSMHDLLADHARNAFSSDDPEPTAVYTRLLRHYTDRLTVEPFDVDLMRDEHPTLLACLRLPAEDDAVVQFGLQFGHRLVDKSFEPDAAQAFAAAQSHAEVGSRSYAQATYGYGRSLMWSNGALAIPLLEDAIRLFQQFEDTRHEVRALRHIVEVSVTQGTYLAEYDERALELCRRLNDPAGEADVLVSLAREHLRKGRYPDALRCCQRALELLRHGDVTDRHGEAHLVLGRTYMRMGEYAAADENLVTATRIFSDNGFRRGEAMAQGGRGEVAYDTGRYEEAIRMEQRALAFFEEIHDRHSQMVLKIRIGRAAVKLGNLTEARDSLGDARKLCDIIGGEPTKAIIDISLADATLAGGEPATAADMFRTAISVLESTGYRRFEAQAHYGLGRSAAAVGDTAQARQHLGRALEIFEEIGSPQAAEVQEAINGSR